MEKGVARPGTKGDLYFDVRTVFSESHDDIQIGKLGRVSHSQLDACVHSGVRYRVDDTLRQPLEQAMACLQMFCCQVPNAPLAPIRPFGPYQAVHTR